MIFPHLKFAGASATFCGYFLQGASKFGFYEFFKDRLFRIVDKYGYDTKNLEFPIWITASGCAEVLASCVLCPLEATKIYMITNPQIVRQGTISRISSIVKTNGVLSLYTGLPLLLLRQVPYTCVKLSGYEIFYRLVRRATCVIQEKFPNFEKCRDSASLQFSQQLFSGVLSGIGAAFVSQPADVLLSKLCGSSSDATVCYIVNGVPSFLNAMKELGIRGCYSGILPRAAMVGALTALQFGVYENVRRLLCASSCYDGTVVSKT